MADVFWVGKAKTTRMVRAVTVGSNTATETFTITIAGKTYSVTADGVLTPTQLAAALYALVSASTEPEYAELTWSTSTTTVTATGPTDGRPFTLTAGGTGTCTASTTTAASSPNDAAAVANYSTGALPTAASRLVFQGDVPDVLWNLDALTNAITAYRAASHTGRIGLPLNSDSGYPEYRPRFLELNAVTITAELNARDRPGQLRLKGTSGSACTFTVTGPGTTALPGQEVVEAHGFVSTSAVRVVGASVSLCPEVGQTATVTSVTGTSSVLTLGAGLTPTTVVFDACTARVACGYTTLTLDGGSSVETVGATAAATSTLVQGGRVAWRSTGTPGALTVGSGGVFDAAAAPASVAVGAITLLAGGALVNPFDRLTRPYTVTLSSAEVGEVGLSIGTGMNFTVN